MGSVSDIKLIRTDKALYFLQKMFPPETCPRGMIQLIKFRLQSGFRADDALYTTEVTARTPLCAVSTGMHIHCSHARNGEVNPLQYTVQKVGDETRPYSVRQIKYIGK